MADDDLERLPLIDVLAGRQAGPLSPPMAQTVLLPLHELDPGVFERVVVELAWRVENARDVQLYGRRGQKQYGLDVVGTDRSGDRFVYQARRLGMLTPSGIRQAVVDYAGPPRTRESLEHPPPRRLEAKRFVLATSAQLDVDAALVDELERLRAEYRGDLEVDVYGAEKISHALRDAVGVVAGIFGPEWARAFCGMEPPAVAAGEPTAYGLLEDPLTDLGLAEVDIRAQQLRTEQPQQTAQIEQELAARLQKAGYPGHADLHRRRYALALRAAGELAGAFDQLWEEGFGDFERGATRLDDTLEEQLEEIKDELPPTAAARLTVLRCALEWYGQGSQLPLTVSALQKLAAARDPWATQLTCIVLEQALVDGLYSSDPPRQIVGGSDHDTDGSGEKDSNGQWVDAAALTRALLLIGEDASNEPDRTWRARLQCAIADARLELARAKGSPLPVDDAYGELQDEASAGRFPPGAGALVHARAARMHALANNARYAIDACRRSIIAASAAGLYGDVRNAFQDVAQAAFGEGNLSQMPDLALIARSLPNRDRLLAAAHDPALTALEAARRGKLPDAFEDARRYLWETRLSGQLLRERWALHLFADVLAGANREAEAVEPLVTAGEGNRAAELARTLSTWVDVTAAVGSAAPWQAAAAAQVIAVQVDLIPDAQVEPLAHLLLERARPVLQATGIGPQPAVEALKALARLGVRLPESVADPLLEIVGPALKQDLRVSDNAVEIVANLYRALPHRRSALAARLMEATALSSFADAAWDAIRSLRGQRQPLDPEVRRRAEDGDPRAVMTLAAWGEATPAVRRAARQAAAALLRTPVGHPRTMFTMDTVRRDTATLVAALLAGGDADDGLMAEDLAPVVQPRTGPGQEGMADTRTAEASVGADAGGTTDDRDHVSVAEEPGEEAGVTAGGPRVATKPDQAANTAAGPVGALGDAVAAQLLDMADDGHDAAFRRLDAILALRKLIPWLPASTCSR